MTDVHQMVMSFTDRELYNDNAVSKLKLIDSGTGQGTVSVR